jgi:HEAT repeat protein
MSTTTKILVGFLAIVAISLWSVQHTFQQHNEELERRIAHVEADLRDLEVTIDNFEDERKAAKWNTLVESSAEPEELLERALEDIGHKNFLIRYQAARTIKKYGPDAADRLIVTLENGNKAAKETALLLLGDLRDPASAPGLRALADSGNNENLRAGALTVLAKMRDDQSSGLFVNALNDSDKRVRTAALTGVRRLSVFEAIGPLLTMLDGDELFSNEVRRCLSRLAAADPEKFTRFVGNLKGDAKFKIIKVFAAADDDASKQIVRSLLDDNDPRVALTAARVLAPGGDQAARDVARRVAATSNDKILKGIAEEILKELTP